MFKAIDHIVLYKNKIAKIVCYTSMKQMHMQIQNLFVCLYLLLTYNAISITTNLHKKQKKIYIFYWCSL